MLVQTIMRRPAVEEATGLCCSEIYARIERGEFPRPVPLGPKSVGWLSDEIARWIEARAAAREAIQASPRKRRRGVTRYTEPTAA